MHTNSGDFGVPKARTPIVTAEAAIAATHTANFAVMRIGNGEGTVQSDELPVACGLRCNASFRIELGKHGLCHELTMNAYRR